MWQKIMLILALMISGPGSGALAEEWPAEPKRVFIQECQTSCRNNSALTSEAQKAKCPDYCQCGVEVGEQNFSTAEFRQMDDDARANRDTPAMRRFAELMRICNRRTWGR
jgi:hypothetical protein